MTRDDLAKRFAELCARHEIDTAGQMVTKSALAARTAHWTPCAWRLVQEAEAALGQLRGLDGDAQAAFVGREAEKG